MDRKDPHFVRYRRRVTRALQPFRQLRAIVATLVGQNQATSSCDDDACDERRQAVWVDTFRLGGVASRHGRVWSADVASLIRAALPRDHRRTWSRDSFGCQKSYVKSRGLSPATHRDALLFTESEDRSAH
jgi:hypothetical protein